MPSNKDLTKSIKDLDPEAETEGLSNKQLSALLSELRDKANTDADADAGKPPFYVSKGKAITSKRGILADGDEIKADDLAGGKDALEAFVKSGHVAKA